MYCGKLHVAIVSCTYEQSGSSLQTAAFRMNTCTFPRSSVVIDLTGVEYEYMERFMAIGEGVLTGRYTCTHHLVYSYGQIYMYPSSGILLRYE